VKWKKKTFDHIKLAKEKAQIVRLLDRNLREPCQHCNGRKRRLALYSAGAHWAERRNEFLFKNCLTEKNLQPDFLVFQLRKSPNVSLVLNE